jgi:predicted nucleic acid-binding protein
MKEKLAIDSSVLIKVLLDNKKEILLSLVTDYELFAPSNVLEETAYKIISLTISDIIGSKKFYKIKEAWESDLGEEEIKKRIAVLEDLTDKIINILYIGKEIVEISKKVCFGYKLLPNDALIAATCKHYGIKKIATLDPDFKRVDFLEVIELEG